MKKSILVMLALAGPGRAGVLYTTDLEAVALGQGGAYVAAPATGSAVWYNPAGLAAQQGLRVEAEGGIIDSPLTYDPAPGDGRRYAPVKNTDTLLPAGLFGVTGGVRSFTFGLFAYTPSSSAFAYPSEDPQRYQGLGGSYVLAFFHGAVAYRIGKLSLGVAIGPAYFHATQDNAVAAAPAGTDPHADIWTVGVRTNVSSPLFLTETIGASFAPAPGWAIGASVMPPFDVNASGTIKLSPSDALASYTTIQGDAVSVHLRFPAIVRAGVRWSGRPGLAVELAGVWEGWSRFKSIDLQPDVTVSAPAFGVTDQKIGEISLAKGYKDLFSVRLGAERAVRPWLTARAGAYFESMGSSTAQFDVTAPEANKVALSVGASFRVLPSLFVDVAYAHTFFPDVNVTDSQLTIRNVLEPMNTDVVGNGRYATSLDFVHLGVRVQR
jgi:long-chain fatty acid transport protein